MGEARRRRLRLRHYDYASAGGYFVTVCTAARVCRFGEIVDGGMQMNDVGHELAAQWEALPARFPRVTLDAFVVMPNHLHGLLALRACDASEWNGPVDDA